MFEFNHLNTNRFHNQMKTINLTNNSFYRIFATATVSLPVKTTKFNVVSSQIRHEFHTISRYNKIFIKYKNLSVDNFYLTRESLFLENKQSLVLISIA